MSEQSPASNSGFQSERRSFLTGLNSKWRALAAMAVGGAALAQGKPAPKWQPARHEKDDWLDNTAVKHRLVFDTTNADGFGEALAFAGNYLRVNQSDYGLQDSDLSVVIVARHGSTAFAYNDAIWAKYGAPIATRSKFEDPKTKQPPIVNVFNIEDYGTLLSNRGTTVNSILKRGVQLAVCSTATRALASTIAKAVGGDMGAINSELIANLLSNSRMVPAGIVAVSRAQERGYTFVKG
jgi:intracellular sulfur oxidation DsrE/DsrF family protein